MILENTSQKQICKSNSDKTETKTQTKTEIKRMREIQRENVKHDIRK